MLQDKQIGSKKEIDTQTLALDTNPCDVSQQDPTVSPPSPMKGVVSNQKLFFTASFITSELPGKLGFRSVFEHLADYPGTLSESVQ